MSTQEAICVQFPNGYVEFPFTSATPCVGDRIRRGDDEFEVATIRMDSNENRIVTLGPPGDGMESAPTLRDPTG